MSEYRVVSLRQQTVDEVRNSLRAPGYGHPAHVFAAREKWTSSAREK